MTLTKKGSLDSQIKFVYSKHKYPGMIGGLGSSKSDAAVKRVLHLKYKHPETDVLYLLPSYDLVKLMAMPRFEEELTRIKQKYTLNKSEFRIDLKDKGSILFRSMANPERIIAFEVGDSVLDELDTLKKDKAKVIFRKVVERTRAKKADGSMNTVATVTTPDQGTSGQIFDMYGRCIDKSTMVNGDYDLLNDGMVGNYHLIEANTADNHYLPDDYLDEILELYDPVLAALYTRGKMVSLTTDKVYHYYDRDTHSTLREIQPKDKLFIGVDFNVGGCACVVFVRDGNIFSAVDEFAPKNTDSITIEINSKYQGHRIELLPDATGDNESSNASRSDIQILRDEVRTPLAPTINAPKANGAIRDRINAVNKKLSNNTLMVNYVKCPRLSNALAEQGYDEKGKPEKSDDHTGGAVDDFTDSAGYGVVRIFPIRRKDSYIAVQG